MSGELQTIPARHGVATFVPRGRTIKVINTYGKQVVSMWAFSLGPPPDDGEDGGNEEIINEEDVRKEAEGLKQVVEEGDGDNEGPPPQGEEVAQEEEKKEENEDGGEEGESKGKETASSSKVTETTKDDDEDPPEQAPDTPEGEQATEKTEPSSKQPAKRTWGSYLPSIPYRNKGTASKAEAEPKRDTKEEKEKAEANTKTWSSYLATGKGFSNYIPNVQLPDSKEAMSAFTSSHYRDPNKSYAEQLYDFSKTPVGAGSLAAATGSGYASAVYSAYSAYALAHPSASQQPPMEYLSLPHTRAASHKLVPEVDDELLTNLRNPIITLVEDTSPGGHDTLTAACDANLYNALGVEKPEEHGSCAENLVLALKELNEEAGLKGAKSIGADITVNIAPTPLHLFMNAPLQLDSTTQSEGAGAKGAILKVEEPKGKKRVFVRFRAERDIVVVFSACPMEIGSQNGGRCMAANFMVEDVQEGEDLATSVSSLKAKKPAPKKLSGEKKSAPKKEESKEDGKQKAKQDTKDDTKLPDEGNEKPARDARRALPRKLSAQNKSADTNEKKKDEPKKTETNKDDTIPQENAKKEEPKTEEAKSDEPKPKKKPKKLQVRGASASTGSSTTGKSA